LLEVDPEAPSPGASLAGIWHSRYSYYSSRQARDLDAEHYVVLRQRDSHLSGQSLPHSFNRIAAQTQPVRRTIAARDASPSAV